jgi:signal transduction histidine kinase
MDHILVREARILSLINQGLFKETLAEARSIIRDLEITILDKIPAKAPPESVHTDGSQCLSFQEIYDMDKIANPNIDRVMHVLLAVLPTAFLTEPSFFNKLVFTLLDLSLRYGNSEASAGAYATFGIALRRLFPDEISASYQYGRLALGLLDLYPATSTGTIVFGAHNVMIRHWCEPAFNSWRGLTDSSRISFQLGNYEHGAYNISYATSYDGYLGVPLDKALNRAEKAVQTLADLKVEVNLGVAHVWHAIFHNLIEGPKSNYELNGPLFVEKSDIKHWRDKGHTNSSFALYMGKAMLAYFFGESRKAMYFLEECQPFFQSFELMIDAWQITFYRALAQVDVLIDADAVSDESLEPVRDLLAKLQSWNQHCPENFANKCALVEAELARAEGQAQTAMRCYDDAIQKAKDQRLLHEAGLACERAAKFYAMADMQRFARLYAEDAAQYYAAWGSKAKLYQLEHDFGIPIPSMQQGKLQSKTEQQSSDVMSGLTMVDSIALMEAYQTLSSEVVLGPLLEKFLAIAVRNAGAQWGYIVLEKDGELDWQQVIRYPEANEAKPPLKMAKSIALYVVRTREDVVLENVSQERQFNNDPYIKQHHPRSVLCFPLVHKDKSFGVLYLENNLSSGSFIQERVELLRLLMAQAVISIDNANMYRQMESKIESRTLALKEAQDQLIHSGKLAAIGELASGVAHELNQPLAFIRGGAQLELMNLEMGELDRDSLEETLEQVIMGTDRMVKIVSHLRDFARTTDLNVPIPVNLHEVIENALMMTEQQFVHRNIKIIRDFASDDLTVQGHADKLEQVVINLLCNARDALADREAPYLLIQTRWTTQGDSVDSLELVLSDNGPGIPEGVMENIFTPFYTTKSEGEGTGLGLSISKQIIQDHGGNLHVESTPGEGATFTITLPTMMSASC